MYLYIYTQIGYSTSPTTTTNVRAGMDHRGNEWINEWGFMTHLCVVANSCGDGDRPFLMLDQRCPSVKSTNCVSRITHLTQSVALLDLIGELFSKAMVLSRRLCSPNKHDTLNLYTVPLDMKGCICHFTKWQIHPSISKGTIYVNPITLYECYTNVLCLLGSDRDRRAVDDR